MDYEKPWNPSSNLQFPIAIRNIVYQTFRFRPLKKLGHTYYQMTAKKIGKVLQSIASSSKVFLTGAEEELFIPGISELNFLIVKDREIREREIWDLRTEYFEIKRKFPMMGDLNVTCSSDLKRLESSASASSNWFSDRKKLSHDNWKSSKPKESIPAQLSSQLALSVHYFSKAQKYLISSRRKSSAFYRIQFLKYIGRTLFLCSGENLESLNLQTPAVLMAHAYYQIQQLAERAHEEQRPNKLDFKLNFREKKGARFGAEILNRGWVYKLRKIEPSFTMLRASSCPLVLVPQSNLTLVSAVNIFSHFVALFSSFDEEPKEVPLIVSPATFDLLSSGWHWGNTFSHLNWAYPAQVEDNDWLKHCRFASHYRLKESLLLGRNLIIGNLISQSPENIHRTLKDFTRLSLIAKAKENLSDLDLINKFEQQYPNTTQLFELLIKKQRPINLQSLVRGTLNVLKEGQSALYS